MHPTPQSTETVEALRARVERLERAAHYALHRRQNDQGAVREDVALRLMQALDLRNPDRIRYPAEK